MILQRTLNALLSMLPHGFTESPGMLGPGARIVRQFRHAGALTPRTARRFYPRSSAEAAAFAALLEEFIICQSTPGRYFLNLDTLQRSNRFFGADSS